MFNTMTITKAGGSLCAALLVFLLGAWLADSIYSTGHGYGEDVAQGYAIVVEEEAVEETEVAAVDEAPFEEVFANASAEAGEGLWRQCSACHQLEDGANATGPHLYAVVGRDKGSVEGYAYSEILTTQEGDWTPENLSGFLLNPREYSPGTTMAYRGMADVEDRANLIAFLQTIGG